MERNRKIYYTRNEAKRQEKLKLRLLTGQIFFMNDTLLNIFEFLDISSLEASKLVCRGFLKSAELSIKENYNDNKTEQGSN